ncbi:hypothetical protein [Methanosarcina sp. MSH10X1]|uniref:hypothetical protein n=1 Tax=Methanosarcina sp. MSH10X1 TaxID=2507075 RepID=UPI0013E3FB42|nr:hypothetical protein [Methanosarcina sp. MSH10X1]
MIVRGDSAAGSVLFRKRLVIPPSMTAMAPLAMMVVRTIFLNSLKRTIVFSRLKGIDTKIPCIKSESSSVKR